MRVTTTGELGAALRARRKERALTQAQLADLCGVSVRFVSEVERGRPTAGVGLVLRLCARLGLDVGVAPRGEASR
ncbi:MAG: helix-turn-helix transcriptional regulator [Deltaproteobacteria bacterium]|nr:helix-turn-helix transcriptional regulator [Deltaproteobacteria bacterium]